MPRIREYQPQVSPQQGLVQVRRASAEDFGGAEAEALQGFARAGMAFADAMQAREENSELSNAQTAVADYHKWAMEDLDAQGREAQPGDMAFAGKIESRLRERADELTARYQTPKAQEYVRQQTQRLSTQFYAKAMDFQSDLVGRQAKEDRLRTKQTNSSILYENPAEYAAVVDRIRTEVIGGVGHLRYTDPVWRQAQERDEREEAAWYAAAGWLKQDPHTAAAVLVPDYYREVMSGEPAKVKSAAGWKGFETAVAKVLEFEGGYVAKDGASGAPAKFGINQKAHPNVDVSKLTKDAAVEIYRKQYWDAIGADTLPPAAAMVAFDAAVNHGVDTAKQLLAKTGGDPAAMLAERRKLYKTLAKQPGHAGSLKGWLARLDKLEGALPAEEQAVPTKAAALPATAPAFLQDLTPANRIRLEAQARSQITHAVNDRRQELGQMIDDHFAEAGRTGGVTAPLKPSDFAVFGKDAEKMIERYDLGVQAHSFVHNVATMPLAKIDAEINRLRPAAGAPDYEYRNKLVAQMEQAKSTYLTARQKDPLGFTQEAGGLKPLDLTTPDTLGLQITARVGKARNIARDYGTAFQLLSRAEAEGIRASFSRMPVADQMEYVKKLRTAKMTEPEWNSFTREITDDKVLALGASLLRQQGTVTSGGSTYRPEDVVHAMWRGRAMLGQSLAADKDEKGTRPNYLPDKATLQRVFAEEVGDAFGENASAAAEAFEAVQAYFVGKVGVQNLAGKENSSVTQKAMKESIRVVLGDIGEIGGKTVVPPWGMTFSDFEDKLAANLRADGRRADRYLDLDDYTVMPVGVNKYAVVEGEGAARQILRINGRPAVYDMAR